MRSGRTAVVGVGAVLRVAGILAVAFLFSGSGPDGAVLGVAWRFSDWSSK